MKAFDDTYRGEWKEGDAPLVDFDESVCEVSIGKHTFVYLVPVHLIDDFKEWLVIGNWFGDDLPDYGPEYDGTVDEFFCVIGLTFKETPLIWPLGGVSQRKADEIER